MEGKCSHPGFFDCRSYPCQFVGKVLWRVLPTFKSDSEDTRIVPEGEHNSWSVIGSIGENTIESWTDYPFEDPSEERDQRQNAHDEWADMIGEPRKDI